VQQVENQPHTVIQQRRLRQIFFDAATFENSSGRVDGAITTDQFRRGFERAIEKDAINSGFDEMSTPECFRARFHHIHPAEWVEELQTLCGQLFESITLIMPLDSNRLLQPATIALASKFIHHEEFNLKIVLQQLVRHAASGCFRIMAPLPVSSLEDIMWDVPLVKAPLDDVIARNGFVNVYGPRGAGKTTRILGLLHELPPDVDVCYVDLKDALNETEMLLRMASQLGFPYSVYDDMYGEALCKQLDNMNFNKHGRSPVFVLDGFDNHVIQVKKKTAALSETSVAQNNLLAGIARIISLVERYLLRMCTVLVSTHPISADDIGLPPKINVVSIRIGELPVQLAQILAAHYHPSGMSDLRKAAKNHAGTMVQMGEHHSFIGIRSVAKLRKGNKTTYNHIEYNNTLCEDIAISLTKLETQCAIHLWRGMTPFDMGMGWVLCKKAFSGMLSCAPSIPLLIFLVGRRHCSLAYCLGRTRRGRMDVILPRFRLHHKHLRHDIGSSQR
jgi:hypothetical protein